MGCWRTAFHSHQPDRQCVTLYRRGGHIQVEIVSGNGMITLRVCDDGPGISIAERERVFDRYYRVTVRSYPVRVGVGNC